MQSTTLLLLTSIVLLGLAAVGGLVMAGMRLFGGRSPPPALAMLHGFLAAAAVTLLAYGAATVDLPSLALAALALLVLAAVGGAVLNLKYHWLQLPLPRPLLFAHAGIAVLGFLLLLGAAGTTPAA